MDDIEDYSCPLCEIKFKDGEIVTQIRMISRERGRRAIAYQREDFPYAHVICPEKEK